MEKIYRKDKIELLGNIYLNVVNGGNSQTSSIFNEIIINSIGVSGLEKVKKIAWKNEPEEVQEE